MGNPDWAITHANILSEIRSQVVDQGCPIDSLNNARYCHRSWLPTRTWWQDPIDEETTYSFWSHMEKSSCYWLGSFLFASQLLEYWRCYAGFWATKAISSLTQPWTLWIIIMSSKARYTHGHNSDTNIMEVINCFLTGFEEMHAHLLL